jgi:hypothetical protein
MTQAQEIVEGKQQNQRTIPESVFEFRIDDIEPNKLPTNRIDPSLIPLKNSTESFPLPPPPAETKDLFEDKKSPIPVVKEVACFNDWREGVPSPHTHFSNLLFVYPQSIFFTNFRNISIKVQFRSSETVLSKKGITDLLSSRSSALEPRTESLLTQVNYHKKNPCPQEEFKVFLPLVLTPTTHLLFTFYKISVKDKRGKRETIGYAVLPLFSNYCVQSGVFDLLVGSELPERYLAAYEAQDAKMNWFNNSQPCFRVRLHLESTVYSTDQKLNRFLQSFDLVAGQLQKNPAVIPMVKLFSYNTSLSSSSSCI